MSAGDDCCCWFSRLRHSHTLSSTDFCLHKEQRSFMRWVIAGHSGAGVVTGRRRKRRPSFACRFSWPNWHCLPAERGKCTPSGARKTTRYERIDKAAGSQSRGRQVRAWAGDANTAVASAISWRRTNSRGFGARERSARSASPRARLTYCTRAQRAKRSGRSVITLSTPQASMRAISAAVFTVHVLTTAPRECAKPTL